MITSWYITTFPDGGTSFVSTLTSVPIAVSGPVSHGDTIGLGVGIGIGLPLLLAAIGILFMMVRAQRQKTNNIPNYNYGQHGQRTIS